MGSSFVMNIITMVCRAHWFVNLSINPAILENWVGAGYPSEPWPDLKVAATLPDIIFPYLRAPIWEQMRGYLIKNGGDYTESQISRNEDDGCLDVCSHHRDPHAIEFGYYHPQTWDWYQIRDVSAPSLWHMSRRWHSVGPIDSDVPEHLPATPVIAAVATPMFYSVELLVRS